MPVAGVGWTRLTASNVVWNGPVRLYGAVLLVSVAGGDVTLYDGVDAVSGRQVLRLEGTADESRPVMFSPPLVLDLGLYVAVGSNVTEVLVVWLSD